MNGAYCPNMLGVEEGELKVVAPWIAGRK